jgi:hypothetical protein
MTDDISEFHLWILQYTIKRISVNISIITIGFSLANDIVMTSTKLHALSANSIHNLNHEIQLFPVSGHVGSRSSSHIANVQTPILIRA